ncbi:hypothetical protein HAX54_018750, partial [Datura stramonium]|nr:hypothetical protein [Datura stramonium]
MNVRFDRTEECRLDIKIRAKVSQRLSNRRKRYVMGSLRLPVLWAKKASSALAGWWRK